MEAAKKRLILIVDDHEDLRAVVRRYLESEGMDVDEAESGEDALVMLKANTPDAMVLDLQMPGISGESLIDRMLAGEAPLVPTVILSGYPRQFEGLPKWLSTYTKGVDLAQVVRGLRDAIEAFESPEVQVFLEMQDEVMKMRGIFQAAIHGRK